MRLFNKYNEALELLEYEDNKPRHIIIEFFRLEDLELDFKDYDNILAMYDCHESKKA